MIDRVHQTIDMLLNKDKRGIVKPSDKDLAIHNSVLEMYDEMLFDINRLINRENKGLISGGLDNATDKLRERIQYYLVPVTPLTYSNSRFTLPSDLKYFDAVLYNDEIVEMCKSNQEFIAVSKTNPTAEYPVGLKQGTTIKILPTTIQTNVKASYLRKPLQAKWTYVVVNSVEVFNPSADDYVDIDIHPGGEDELIIKVLQKLGLNIKDKDIIQMMQGEKQNEFNTENQS